MYRLLYNIDNMAIKFNGNGSLPQVIIFLVILGISPLLSAQEENETEIVLNEAARYLAVKNYSSALDLFEKLPPMKKLKKVKFSLSRLQF